MARSIPPSLAALVEHLELERKPTVTLEEISHIAEEQGLKTPGRIIAHRLARLGWLLPIPVRGAWEFAPADRAGAIPDADPLFPLKALLSASREDLPAALALGSALWIQDLADRSPDQHEVALPYGIPILPALRREYRVLRHTAHLDPAHVGDLPVHRPATVLVHLATRPTDVRSWSGVLDCLSALIQLSSYDEIATELRGRPKSVHVRLAYLTSGVAPELSSRLGIEPAGKVWFGPRRTLRRHDSIWNVADTVLPYHPSEVRRRP